MAKFKNTNVGININTEWIELTQHSKDLKSIQNYLKNPVPITTIDQSGDRITDPETIATCIAAMLSELNIKPSIKQVHLSIPGSLLRIVEMPKIPKSELLIALTTEAERYAIFNDTEAIVDYEILSEEPGGTQKIMLVAIRKDTYEAYTQAFETAKIKITSLEVDTIATIRGFKYSGSMDELLDEIGEQSWGSMHFEPERIRIVLWKGKEILNWREVLLDTTDLKLMGAKAPVLQDLVEEIRRTISMTEPTRWVTSGLPSNITDALTSKIGTEVKPMTIGYKVDTKEYNPSIAAIGITFKNSESFPASINIRSAKAAEESSEFSLAFLIMLGLCGILTSIVILIAIIFFAWNLIIQSEIATINEKNNNTIQEIEKTKNATFIGSADEALIRKIVTLTATNKIISKTLEKTKQSIPNETWISRISIISKRPEGALIDNKPEYLPMTIFFNAKPEDQKVQDNPRTPSEFISGNDKDNTFSIYGTSFNAKSVPDFLTRLYQEKGLDNQTLNTIGNLRLVFLEELTDGKTNYNFLIGSRNWIPTENEALSFNEIDANAENKESQKEESYPQEETEALPDSPEKEEEALPAFPNE